MLILTYAVYQRVDNYQMGIEANKVAYNRTFKPTMHFE